jgi:C1A family cysteine protease
MKTIDSKIGRKYGYFQSRHKNPFAFRYAPKSGVESPLPESVDLQPFCPPVVDQGNTSSCTANAIAGAYQFERMQAQITPLTPSRLFIYWNERAAEGDTGQDAGAFGGDGINSLETIGVCDESLWPFDPSQLTVKPSDSAFAAALPHTVLQRQVVTTLDDIKGAIADKHLVAFGISLYESFESPAVASTGIVPVPSPAEGLLGGHEMDIVGYDDSRQMFKVRNSWGTSWGLSGYCWIPYSYVMSAGSDFEVITAISN